MASVGELFWAEVTIEIESVGEADSIGEFGSAGDLPVGGLVSPGNFASVGFTDAAEVVAVSAAGDFGGAGFSAAELDCRICCNRRDTAASMIFRSKRE